MSKLVKLECACKAVKGELSVVERSFFHVHCLCCDCQEFASYLNNKESILDQHGGTELFQTYPQYLKITQGHDQIRGVQLQEKGIYRWHTACCNMPIANTLTTATIPFVGISVKLMKFSNEQEKSDVLGPVAVKAFGKYAIGKMPNDVHPRFPLSFMPKVIGFMIKGLLTKKSSPSPFFSGKETIVKVKNLSGSRT